MRNKKVKIFLTSIRLVYFVLILACWGGEDVRMSASIMFAMFLMEPYVIQPLIVLCFNGAKIESKQEIVKKLPLLSTIAILIIVLITTLQLLNLTGNLKVWGFFLTFLLLSYLRYNLYKASLHVTLASKQ